MPTINDIVAEFIPVNLNIPAVLKTKTITANGVYNASEDNADGYSSVTVVVPDKELKISELNITPSTSTQTFEVGSDVDVYSPINVSAVTSSIDANIIAGNIKDGVTILGVTGDYQGQVPSGTKSITENGTYDVKDFATADVQVPTTAPDYYIDFTKNYNNVLQPTTRIVDLTGVVDIAKSVFENCYTNNTVINGAVNFSSLTRLTYESSCNSMFKNCTGITSVDLSNLEQVTGKNACSQMFSGCTGLTSFNLSKLKQAGTAARANACSQMFYGCTGLTTADLRNLETVGQYGISQMFYGCTGLTSVNLSSLNSIGFNGCSYMFASCASLTRLLYPALKTNSFGNYTNQFSNMLHGCSNVTVHFPMAIQSIISSWSDVVNGFSGANTTVLFDIVTSITGADTNVYTRQEKDSTGTATAWVLNDVLYYTSGTTEPTVGDTIYSDSACTTAVTTISSIA